MHTRSRFLALVTFATMLTAAACGVSTVLPGDPVDPGDASVDGQSHERPDEAGALPDADGKDAMDATDAGKQAPTKDGGVAPNNDAGAPELKDCGPPGQIFTNPAGPFCPFQAGAVFNHCSLGEHCCHYTEDAAAPSTCEAQSTACGAAIADGVDWRCDEGNDCAGGQVCCFAGPITTHPQCMGQYKGTGSSTACRANACLPGETRTCGTQSDCPVGTTCTGMRMRGKHIGFCKQG